MPEVSDYQVYAGTAAPINFNGLVRQYYLRSGADLGDIQVNLVDKHQRSARAMRSRSRLRPQLGRDRRAHGACVKVVEVPPGPPVLAPIVAEVYGPDYAGRIAVAEAVRRRSAATPDMVDVDDTRRERAAPAACASATATRPRCSAWRRSRGRRDAARRRCRRRRTLICRRRSEVPVPVRLQLPPTAARSLERC